MSNPSHQAINISLTPLKKLYRAREPAGTVSDASWTDPDYFFWVKPSRIDWNMSQPGFQTMAVQISGTLSDSRRGFFSANPSKIE